MTERGSIVLVALAGDYGKPRPALIVQSDAAAGLPSVVVCPLTTTIREDVPAFRITIAPTSENGLRTMSQVMIEKPVAVPRHKLRDTIGRVGAEQMQAITGALSVLLDIA